MCDVIWKTLYHKLVLFDYLYSASSRCLIGIIYLIS